MCLSICRGIEANTIRKIHFQHRLFTAFYVGFKIDVESTDVECIIVNIGFEKPMLT